MNLSFGSTGFDNHPELAVRFLAVVNEWNKVEGTLGVLLGTLLGTPYSVAVATLSSIVNFTSRLDVIRAAAAEAAPRFSTEVSELIDALRARAVERNRVVHGCWATSPSYPDRILFCPPSALAYEAAKSAETGLKDRSIIEAIRPSLSVWGASCFRDLEERISELNTKVIVLNNKVATQR